MVCEVRIPHYHREVVSADGGSSGCPGRLRPNRQYMRERRANTARWWKCCECEALITIDEQTGWVRLDTSRVADFVEEQQHA